MNFRPIVSRTKKFKLTHYLTPSHRARVFYDRDHLLPRWGSGAARRLYEAAEGENLAVVNFKAYGSGDYDAVPRRYRKVKAMQSVAVIGCGTANPSCLPVL